MNEVTEIINATYGVEWGPAIPLYFFFTGVSAAAFLISSFTYVFGDERYQPVAGLSLIVALTVLLAAPLALIADLGQTGRFYSLFFNLHATSPMTWGVFLLTGYPLLIALEGMFAFRAGFARRAQRTVGPLREIYRLLALGNTTVTPETEARDHRMSRILGSIGIPVALAVHGYTGYILGVVRARPLWHTPLMPIIFLISAMVSGVALMIVLTWLMVRDEQGRQLDGLLQLLGSLLGWMIVGDLLMRLFWYSIGFFYSYGSYQYVTQFLFQERFFETVVLELVLGLLVPAVVMFVPALRRIRPVLIVSAFITMAGVALFRWSTVIGGQEIPKTGAGFYGYEPALWGGKGIMTLVAILAFWIFLFIIFTWILPWRNGEKEETVPHKQIVFEGGGV